MSDRHFKALMRAAAARGGRTAERDRFLFYLMGKTGLRISEALSLRVRDFHLGAAPAFVRVRTMKKRGGRRPCDEVLLDERTVRRARRYLYQLPRLLWTTARIEHNTEAYFALPLFPPTKRGKPGQPMSRRNALFVFKTYARLAGIPTSLVLHSLRHYRGTTLLRRSGDLEFTREQMRHSDIRSTQPYLHTDPETIARHLEDAGGDE